MLCWLTPRGWRLSASASRAGLALVATLLGATLLGGCGDDATRIVANTDDPDPIINLLTSANIISVAIDSSTVEVCFTLTDANSDPISILPEWSTDGGNNFFIATEANDPASSGINGLPSSPGGTQSCFFWAPGADGVGIIAPATVVFRVTPRDPFVVGNPDSSDPFTFFDPAVIIDVGTTTALFGATNVQLPVALRTNGTQPVSISVVVLYDENHVVPSVIPVIAGPQALAAGAVVGAVSTLPAGQISFTLSGPMPMTDGIIAFLQFDALIPAVQTPIITPVLCDDVDATSVTLAPLNAVCGSSGEIFLTPNLPPSCSIASPVAGQMLTTGSGFTGDVQVDYTLADAESDTIDITVTYSSNGGISFQPATEAMGAPSEGTTGLLATPGGVPHVFVWDADTDIPTLFTSPASVTVRIVGTDVTSGAPCLTGTFTVDLRNAPPLCAPGTLVVTGASGNISIDFSVTDVESDLIDVVFEYSNGGPFLPATAAVGSGASSPALSLPTPTGVVTFIWDSTADLGPVMTVVSFRITAGDAFNPVLPTFGPRVVSCTSVNFAVDNTARVFQSLFILGPTSPLGSGVNMVTGGPDPSNPCTANQTGNDFAFSQGVNRGRLTAGSSFLAGNNPLVFDDAGQNLQLVVQGNFAGLGPATADLSMALTSDGATTYLVMPGSGGPYVSVGTDGLVTSMTAGGGNGQSGCDTVRVTFTPNGMGMAGGSNGMPMSTDIAACIDYYGWDKSSRDTAGLLAPGDWDASMFGTPSGNVAPGAGGSDEITLVGKNQAGQDPAAFQHRVVYDPAILAPNTTFGTMGVALCATPPVLPSWSAISNPTSGPTEWLVNGFRVIGGAPQTTAVTESICAMSWRRIAAGNTTLITTADFWADSGTNPIVGTFPLPFQSPGASAGFTVP